MDLYSSPHITSQNIKSVFSLPVRHSLLTICKKALNLHPSSGTFGPALSHLWMAWVACTRTMAFMGLYHRDLIFAERSLDFRVPSSLSP